MKPDHNMDHEPVLLNETIDCLDPRPGDVVIDCTINGGGHSRAILSRIAPGGKLLGIDQDEGILEATRTNFTDEGIIGNAVLVSGNFRDLRELAGSAGISGADAILFDLGMSSIQIDKSERGFSFQRDEPLIMSFKKEPGPGDITAADILNDANEEEINRILRDYGEERFAGRISRNIVKIRGSKPFRTTFDLVGVIRNSVPGFYIRSKKHFATKTFQALRLAVNDELNTLYSALGAGWELLAKDGRMAVISFHSLEDRIVKNFFLEKKKEGSGEILTKKPIIPGLDELKNNPRSRSAKLRAIKKSI